jgi:hypothetical protein
MGFRDVQRCTGCLFVASYASSIAAISSGAVTRTVTSSAYATTAVFRCLQLTRTPRSCCLRRYNRGLIQSVKSVMLSGHPWRTEH